MTEFIRNHDRYLDPPEEETHAYCSRCAEWKDIDDMQVVNFKYMCDECYQAYAYHRLSC